MTIKGLRGLAAKGVRLVSLPVLLFALHACAINATGAAATPSPQQTAEVIKRLEAAKEMDQSEANQPCVSAVTWEDYQVQVCEANTVIKKLTLALEVRQSEIDEALWVPPKCTSPAERARLIQQLQVAVQHDDSGEQDLLYPFRFQEDGPYPSEQATRFEEQKSLANSVIRDLEAGEDVHWQTIQRALQVPELEK